MSLELHCPLLSSNPIQGNKNKSFLNIIFIASSAGRGKNRFYKTIIFAVNSVEDGPRLTPHLIFYAISNQNL